MNYFNYFSEIEELFVRRRGRNLLLSPLDWAMIESWQEREVPLHIILGGIERIFDQADKQANQKRPISSLLYCKGEIEAQYAEWLERQVGKNGAAANERKIEPDETAKDAANETNATTATAKSGLFSDEALIEHLNQVRREIQSAREQATGDWAQTLDAVFDSLNQLEGKPHTAESLEDQLEKLDKQIDDALLANFKTDALHHEVEKQLHAYKTKMEPDVYRRTFELMLLKRLRQQSGAPRLSLFDL